MASLIIWRTVSYTLQWRLLRSPSLVVLGDNTNYRFSISTFLGGRYGVSVLSDPLLSFGVLRAQRACEFYIEILINPPEKDFVGYGLIPSYWRLGV